MFPLGLPAATGEGSGRRPWFEPFAALFAEEPAPFFFAYPGAQFGHRRDHVHDRHHWKAQGCRVDACEHPVGLPSTAHRFTATGPQDVSLISLPLFHVVGLCWSFLPVLWAGGTAVLQPRFSASRFWPASSRASRDAGVARVVHLDGAAEPRPCRSGISIASGPSPAATVRRSRTTAFRPSCRRWGMTELIAPASRRSAAPPAEGALGRPSLAHQVRIRTIRRDTRSSPARPAN